MWFLKLLEIGFIFSVQFLPVVDIGVQIWNGITINKMVFVKNAEWTGENETVFNYADYDALEEETFTEIYLPKESLIVFADTRRRRDVPCETEDCILRTFMGDGGTFDPNEDSVTNDLSLRSNFVSIYISENLNFDASYEAIVSIALLQFPAVCLACFGIIRAFQNHGLSGSAVKSSFGALLVMFLPFCFVEFFVLFEFGFSTPSLQFIVEKIQTCVQKVIDLLCGLCSDRCVTRFDLLHFLPSKEANKRDKMLSVEVVKIFFGTCLQLCFQANLLFGYTKVEEIQICQILSLISSFLIICKLGVDIIRFKREAVKVEQNPDNGTIGEKTKAFLTKKARAFKAFLFYFQLMFCSLVFNAGTLILTILVWEEYGALYILAVFLLNLAVSLILPFGFVEQCERKMRIEYKFDIMSNSSRNAAQEKVSGSRVMRGIFVSWSNIFFLSRPVEDTSYFRTVHMLLLQIFRFLLNLITLLILIGYVVEIATFAEALKIKLLHVIIVLILIGLLKIFLIFIYTYHFNCCGKSKSYEPNRLEVSGIEEKIPLTALDSLSSNNEKESDLIECDATKEGNDNLNDTRENSEDEEEQKVTNKSEETALTILDQSTASITKEDDKKGDCNDEKKEDYYDGKHKNCNNDKKEYSYDDKKEDCNNENSSQIPKLERMTSADGSCAIQDTDLEFIGKHSKLTNDDVKKHFKDLLNDGRVDKAAFKNIVEMCYPDLDTERLEKHIFKVFDEDRNGLIEFRKFMLVIYALSSGTPEENLKQIFKLVDRNSDDEITVDEFKEVVHDIFVLANERKVSVSIENQLVKKAFSEMDTNADGKVVLDEFIKACKMHDYIVIIYIKNFAETYNNKQIS